MPTLTLYELGRIHALSYIVWYMPHSCEEAHYMPAHSFMSEETLYAPLYIHAAHNITCMKSHSCGHQHYMQPSTFMRGPTFSCEV